MVSDLLRAGDAVGSEASDENLNVTASNNNDITDAEMAEVVAQVAAGTAAAVCTTVIGCGARNAAGTATGCAGSVPKALST